MRTLLLTVDFEHERRAARTPSDALARCTKSAGGPPVLQAVCRSVLSVMSAFTLSRGRPRPLVFWLHINTAACWGRLLEQHPNIKKTRPAVDELREVCNTRPCWLAMRMFSITSTPKSCLFSKSSERSPAINAYIYNRLTLWWSRWSGTVI